MFWQYLRYFWKKLQDLPLWIFWKKLQDLPLVNFWKKMQDVLFEGGGGGWGTIKTNPLWFLGKKYKTYLLWIFGKNARLTPCDFWEKNTRLTPCEFWEKMQDFLFFGGVGNYKTYPLWILGKKYKTLWPLVNVIFGKNYKT